MANYGEIDKSVAVTAGVCGILILLCGVGDCIAGFVWVSYTFATGSSGFGLWGGIALIIPGILGIVAWPKRSKGLLIAFMVLCIIAIIVAAVQAVVGGLAYTIWNALVSGGCTSFGGGCTCTPTGRAPTHYNDKRVCEVIQSINDIFLTVTILSVFGAILCLAGSIAGCVGACASTGQPGATVVQHPVIIQTAQQPPAYAMSQPVAGGYPMASPGPAASYYPQK